MFGEKTKGKFDTSIVIGNNRVLLCLYLSLGVLFNGQQMVINLKRIEENNTFFFINAHIVWEVSLKRVIQGVAIT